MIKKIIETGPHQTCLFVFGFFLPILYFKHNFYQLTTIPMILFWIVTCFEEVVSKLVLQIIKATLD